METRKQRIEIFLLCFGLGVTHTVILLWKGMRAVNTHRRRTSQTYNALLHT